MSTSTVRLAVLVALLLSASEVRAQRLGTEIDATDVLLAPTTGSQGPTRVAVDGDGYLVLFRDRTTSLTEMRGVRLHADGTVDAELTTHIPQVVDFECRAGECVGVTLEQSSSTAPRVVGVVRFRSDGTLVDAVPITILSTTDDVTPAVEATATGFLVAYSIAAGVRVVPVSFATGVGTEIPIFDGVAATPGVGCGPTVCLVAWPYPGVSGRMLAHDGTPLGAAFTVSASVSWVQDFAVEDSGIDVAVVARDLNRVLTGWRVAYDGTVSAPVSLGAGRNYEPVGLGCDGTGACLVRRAAVGADSIWQWTGSASVGAFTGFPTSTYGGMCAIACVGPGTCVRVDDTIAGTVRVDELLFGTTNGATQRPEFGIGPDVQRGPVAVAGDDAGGLVVFQRTQGAVNELVVSTFDAAGMPAPGTGVVIESEPSTATTLDLALGDGQYGLLSVDGTRTRFRRLRADGNVEGSIVELGAAVRGGAIAWNGTYFLIVTLDSSNRLRTQRLDAVGQRVDATPLLLGSAYGGGLDVASDGDGYLVVHSTGGTLRGIRLDATGAAIDAAGFLIRDHQVSVPRVARAGAGYVASWADVTMDGNPFDPGAYEIRTARISVSGEVLDLGGLVVASAGAPELAVTGTALGAHLAWVDRTESAGISERRVRVVEIANDGSVSPSVEAAPGPGSTVLGSFSGLAIGGGSTPMLAYPRDMSLDPSRAPMRIRMRAVHATTLGAECTVAADCASGFCAAGVCCDSACDGACEACGAAGSCELRSAGTVCRDASGACDVAESCDGSSSMCPAPLDTECDGGAGMEDDAGTEPPTGDASMSVDGGVGELDAGMTPPPPSGGGCSVARSNTSAAAWFGMALAIVAVALRRRRSAGSAGAKD